MKLSRTTGGFGLVEILIGAAIMSAVLISLLAVANNFARVSHATKLTTQASFLLEEGIEALRLIRDKGWDSDFVPLDPNLTYSLLYSGGTWVATTSQTLIDGVFLRTFAVSDVYRDASDDIAASGTLDPDTQKVTVTVEWRGANKATTSRSIATYFTNFFQD